MRTQSRVDGWIVHAPQKWQRTTLKRVGRFGSGGTPDRGDASLWRGEVPWLSPKDMKSRILSETTETVSTDAIHRGTLPLEPAGTLFIVTRGMILAHTVPVVRADVPMTFNQDIKSLRVDAGTIDPSFLAWQLVGLQQQLLSRVETAGHGTKKLPTNRLQDLPLALPPLPTQRAIAAFLDRETAKIDTLIEKKERLLELLEEKRTVLITQAVTKGLDPDVPMKDSGVEWLGEVPAHWEVGPLGSLASVISGGTPAREDARNWGGSIAWFSPKDLKATRLADSEEHITIEGLRTAGLTLLPPGTVLIVVRGMILSRVVPVGVVSVEFAINQDLKALRPSPALDGEYLASALAAGGGALLAQVRVAGHGTRALPTPELRRFPVPIPPVDEQTAIVEFVAARDSRAYTASGAVTRAISLLHEYRSALISAAVTGQLEVPVPDELDPDEEGA